MPKTFVLKNGAKVIAVPVAGTRATTVLAMFPIGSRYETDRLAGISHFVEHLMFKGTKKRPTTLEISRELDAVGAHYNAFTSKEYTGYYIKIAGHKQELAFDILSDILSNSKFNEAEVEKEKGAIVEELRMYQDNPLMTIDQLFEEALFAPHALGRDIGGTEKTVRGVSRQELWDHYQTHYSARSMTLVVSGDVQMPKLKKLVRYFEKQPAPPQAPELSFYRSDFTPVHSLNKKLSLSERVRVKEKKLDQVQLMMGFPGLNHTAANRYALDILTVVLGGGMSSRLFTEVRERRGLVYMIRCETGSFRDSGVLYVQAGIDPSRVEQAVKVIKSEFRRVVKGGITPKELANAKNHVAGNMALQLEDSYAQAMWYASKDLFFPGLETPEESLAKLNRVTAAEVKNIAAELIDFKQLRAAAIGPLNKEKILRLFL